jgi:hypothetical protein
MLVACGESAKSRSELIGVFSVRTSLGDRRSIVIIHTGIRWKVRIVVLEVWFGCDPTVTLIYMPLLEETTEHWSQCHNVRMVSLRQYKNFCNKCRFEAND